MLKKYIITIDGPAATGKSTAGRDIARMYDLPYIYTGLFFRSFAWVLKQDYAEKNGVQNLSKDLIDDIFSCIEYKYDHQKGCTILYQGTDITSKLKHPEIDLLAPLVANNPLVRDAVIKIERFLAQRGGVLDSRDAGTIVFPHADYKFFFVASQHERARRVLKDWQKKGIKATELDALKHVQERDNSDVVRGYFKLVIPDEAFFVDTTFLSQKEVLSCMIERIGMPQ